MVESPRGVRCRVDLDPDQQEQIAIHEAGHVIAMHHLRPYQGIARVSIRRRGKALGYVAQLNKTDIYAQPLSRYYDNIKVSLAGHIATELVLGELWTGATGDFNSVRGNLLALHGYGEMGEFPAFPAVIGQPGFSKAVHKKVQKEMDTLTEETLSLLVKHRKQLDAVTKALLQHGNLNGKQIKKIIGGEE